jgi:hypothetical protein
LNPTKKLPRVSLIFVDFASEAAVEMGSIQKRRSAISTWPNSMARTG